MGSQAQIEERFGHRFQDASLLEQALSHSSWAYESPDERGTDRESNNESLEFIGDAVLGLVISELLYREHPESSEGGLTLMKHRLVSAASLAVIAERLGLGDHLRMGRGEELSGGRSKGALLANAFEAVLGAIFLDAGYTAVRDVIARLFENERRNVDARTALDNKSKLQEFLQSKKLGTPRYSVVNSEGPPHERVFYVRAEWSGGESSGSGPTKKSAEMMAAGEALKMLGAAKK